MVLTPVNANQEAYLASFGARERDSLHAVRETAMERFAVLGFPTTKNEEWKYSNLTPWLKMPYEKAPRSAGFDPGVKVGPNSLVFVNGWFAPEFSRVPAGVKAGSLREIPPQPVAPFAENAMLALNTALFEDGAHIEIDGVLQEPLFLMFISAGRYVSYPRNRIVVRGEARIVEQYIGEGPYFTNAVTELEAAAGASVEHCIFQRQSVEALHFHHLAVRQKRDSNVRLYNLAFGGGMVRNEVLAVLDGEGAHCALSGLYVTRGTEHVDNHTTLDHAKPNSTSHELYKGVLDDRSQGVFHGRIIVRPEAQKTDAIQRNRNLLLSREAVVNTKPQLEIYADDVRCTHGATVGQVDEDAVFYLRSRGVGRDDARKLLTNAFASEILDDVKVEAVREQASAALLERLG
ncbi:MAG TPA: Fe-S cluster assembly protein SufD [Bryobacteraceae bacterium]|nr:Fe-S cluster assembly protein SufD [Bryobacteraceae bacterium]